MDVKPVLKRIGLNEGEIKVYLALLKLGSVNVNKIKLETKLHRTSIYDFLDKLNKTGLIEISSDYLKKKNFSAIPSWMEIPEHRNLTTKQLILTTYKVNVQTHSRTANNRWLTELYHDNPALINPDTARKFKLKNGDLVNISSNVGEVVTSVKVTEGVKPGVIAISFHLGHWEYGEFASGNKASSGHKCITDCEFVWWNTYGKNPNWVIPSKPDPIGGQQRWMDTVVEIKRM